MGGRGSAGASGLTSDRGIMSRLSGFPGKTNFPALEGSDRQVAWANQLRRNSFNYLYQEAVERDENGYQFGHMRTLMAGKEAMLSEIKSSTKSIDKEVKGQWISRRVEAYNSAAERYGRLKTMFESHKSAKYWIDHRDANSMAELKNIVLGKKK